jgi:hypothetical protein
MSELSVGQLKGLTVNSNIIDVPSGHTLYAPGHVIQVVNVDYNGRVSQGFSGLTIMNITGLEAKITPKKANSKIVIQARWFGEFSAQDRVHNSVFGISRNGVQIGRQPDAGLSGLTAPAISYDNIDGNSTPETAILFVSDLPNTTLEVTYRMTLLADAAATLFTNRVAGWASQSNSYELGASGMMLMEIAQ